MVFFKNLLYLPRVIVCNILKLNTQVNWDKCKQCLGFVILSSLLLQTIMHVWIKTYGVLVFSFIYMLIISEDKEPQKEET